jgi:hypothetical protein
LIPIVAWEIERHEQPSHTPWQPRVTREVTPLTAMGNMSNLTPWAIRSPDGRFDVNGLMLNSEADALRELHAEQEVVRTTSARSSGLRPRRPLLAGGYPSSAPNLV